MTLSMAGPGPTRLLREAVRIVSIPYAAPFSQTDDRNLVSTVKVGMAADEIVKKRTLKLRLQAPGVGRWQCPRRSDGHKGKKVHLLAPKEALTSPGYCQIHDPEISGAVCGRKLEVEETHWPEMAEAFGFLESQGDSYVLGKFGQLAKFLAELRQPSYFNEDNARAALFLDSLLENHADFVLPVLWAVENFPNYDSDWIDSVLEIVVACLHNKREVLSERRADVRGTINFAHGGIGILRKATEDKLDAFDVSRHESCDPRNPNKLGHFDRCVCKRFLLKKVRASYVTKTRTYLEDLGLIAEVSGKHKRYQLTGRGRNLVAELRSHGFMADENTCHVPPGFEAVHDVMSIGMEQYAHLFSPPFSRQLMERILMRCVLPCVEPEDWESRKADLASILPMVVKSVGNKINNGARIDTVRSALFLYQIGRGIPTIMDDSEHELPKEDLAFRRNAVVWLAAEEPDTYLLGSARVGRRLWSINLLRNPTHSV